MRVLLLSISGPTIAVISVGSFVLVAMVVTLIVLLRRNSQPVGYPCGGCGRPMSPEWTRCMFCNWQSAPAQARLEFMSGPLAGQVLPLEEDVTTMGSVSGNTVVLADPAVSRKHVGIRRNENGYEFADLGSTNGVYWNGERTPKMQLGEGDVLRVGNTEMVFRAS
jgi:hypothetical protein